MPGSEEFVEIASDFSVGVLFVASYDHHINEEKSTYAVWKYVDSGKEAADLFIMTKLTKILSKFAGI